MRPDIIDALRQRLLEEGIPAERATDIACELRRLYGGGQHYIHKLTPIDEIEAKPPNHPLRVALARGDYKYVASRLRVSIFAARQLATYLAASQNHQDDG